MEKWGAERVNGMGNERRVRGKRRMGMECLAE